MHLNTLSDARYLWELCFPDDSPDFLDFYFARVAHAEDTYIDYRAEDAIPVAHIGVLRYTYGEQDDKYLAYISGACTHPEMRRRGLMDRLMQRVIHEEDLRGTDALILIPASPELRQYYRKHFGFVDLAPMYELDEENYRTYTESLGLSSVQATSPAELLRLHYRAEKHIHYTARQAENILAEYTEAKEGLLLTRRDDSVYTALMLARQTSDECYVDVLIGDYASRQVLIAELRLEIGTKPIKVGYLFDPKLSTWAIPQAWAMIRPLSPKGSLADYRDMGVSLVHN